MKFTEFDLNDELLKGINSTGFSDLMPVQEKVFFETLKGQDIVVQSQTGTGKTAAFLISIFHNLLKSPGEKALVITPTRELAVQIEEEAKLLGRFLPFKAVSFFGGVGYHRQEKQINEGVDIIVGTPGRLLDLNMSGKLNLHDITMLVIDEADRLFDMGFYPDLKRILRRIPKFSQRKTMLFSATLPVRIRNLAWEFMNSPVEIIIEPNRVTVDEISQELYHVATDEKFSLLLGIIKSKNPKSALIFTNTKIAAVEIAQRLKFNGIKSYYIMGDLPQSKRLQVIAKAKSGQIPVLVATDVAARGLHIEDLEMVVNYDMPEDCENYVHRIGRTARAGKSGKAISLACEKFIYSLPAIESFLGQKIPVMSAEDSLYENDLSLGKVKPKDKYLRRARSRKSPRTSNGNKPRTSTRNSSRTTTANNKSNSNSTTQTTTTTTATATAALRNNKSEKRNQNKPLNNKRYNKKTPSKNNENGRKNNSVSRKPVPNKKIAPQKVRNKTPEERLSYYKEKYGENFTISSEVQNPKPKAKKKSFFGKIKKLFKKDNSKTEK